MQRKVVKWAVRYPSLPAFHFPKSHVIADTETQPDIVDSQQGQEESRPWCKDSSECTVWAGYLGGRDGWENCGSGGECESGYGVMSGARTSSITDLSSLQVVGMARFLPWKALIVLKRRDGIKAMGHGSGVGG